MKRLFKIFSLSTLLILGAGVLQEARAYPQYIRLGYHSCLGCHYNPAGGGMLTPYGKGISTTQSFFSAEMSEEEEEALGNKKYFQAMQARVLSYNTKEKQRIFPMQLEYMGRYDINSKIKTNVTFSIAPKPESTPAENAPKAHQRAYARVAEVTYSLDDQQTLLAGISPLPLGLGLIDHTAYVRAQNRLQITDIPINLRYTKNAEAFSLNAFAYLPHYLEKETNKEKGLGGQYWWRLSKYVSLGTQGLYGTSEAINRTLGGLLFKTGFKEHSFLAEGDYTHRKLLSDQSQFGQWTYYGQYAYHPVDWLTLSYVFQGLSRDRDFKSKETTHSLFLQTKVWRYLTFIAESRMRVAGNSKSTAHLLQAFVQWW